MSSCSGRSLAGFARRALRPLGAALLVPLLLPVLRAADAGTAVWLFDQATGTVSLRNVAVRDGDAAAVQVTSGLKPGDVVVTAGVQALRPGQKVRLLETRP